MTDLVTAWTNENGCTAWLAVDGFWYSLDPWHRLKNILGPFDSKEDAIDACTWPFENGTWPYKPPDPTPVHGVFRGKVPGR